MARASEWRKRIAEWRASGLSAAKFAESRGYSAHQVWNWAAKFRREDAARTAEPTAAVQVGRVVAHSIPLARVLRVPRQESAEKPVASATAMAVEVGGMRLVVPSGFDRGTLAMVLDELEARKPRLGAG
jgi:crotonobetainyl-CoA:carnitine CoA-transferase CaiB-like acyl-CoA transferase